MENIIGLENFKVVKSTATLIRKFVWENRKTLSNEMKLFYQDVAAMVESNAAKKNGTWHKVSEMKEILEMAYNIEKHVIASGAASYKVQFVA